MSRISPIETIEELRQLLFDLPGDTAVEINADISITATNVVELYRSPWQGPIALVIHHDPGRQRIGLIRVEQP
jgi:hypothetical protein